MCNSDFSAWRLDRAQRTISLKFPRRSEVATSLFWSFAGPNNPISRDNRHPHILEFSFVRARSICNTRFTTDFGHSSVQIESASQLQRPQSVEQDTRRPTIILVVVEDALLDRGIPRLHPAVKPFDRGRTRRVNVTPMEP